MAPNKWIVICCPVSGKKTAKSMVESELMPAFKDANIDAEVVYTERKAHATELAEQYADPNVGLIAIGGDGTIHEVMDGLLNKKMLDQVQLGILSQGSMNFFAISSGLPEAKGLVECIKKDTYRKQSLMYVKSGDRIDTNCFEAMYYGVGYVPAKGAQKWRSTLGPMFGIMSNLIYANIFPSSCAVSGTMKLTLKGGETKEITGNFFSFIVTQRSPYSGAITEDEMWVSYISLDAFPGFSRMMEFFTPPMELISGMINCYEAHHCITRFEWVQDKKCGEVKVCLDGDPMEGESSIVVEHKPSAWKIMAEAEFPTKVPDEHISVGKTTEPAKKWLEANPPPELPFVQKPTK